MDPDITKTGSVSSKNLSSVQQWTPGYQLLEPLGSGGAGTVWKARDDGGGLFALKLLHPTVSADQALRESLKREVRLVNAIPGPGIAYVHDFEVDALHPFVVTDLVAGPTLQQLVAEHGPLEGGQLRKLGAALAAVLDRVHGAGVAHRDLKPANVILSPKGPTLIDFGIAQGEADSRLTATGFVKGTPGYVSPVILTGQEVSFPQWRAGDWFAWVALLCFAATGRPPFGSGDPALVLQRVLAGQPDTQGLPHHWQRGFAQALSLPADPERRQELLDAFTSPEPFSTGSSSPQTVSLPPAPPPTTALPPGPQPAAASQIKTLLATMQPMETTLPEPTPRARVFTALVWGVLTMAAALIGPLFLGAVLLGFLLLTQTVGFGLTYLRKRNLQGKGLHKAGGAGTGKLGALLPWHLLKAALTLVPGVLLGTAAFFLVGSIAQSALSQQLELLLFWELLQTGSVCPALLSVSAASGIFVALALPSSNPSNLAVATFADSVGQTRLLKGFWMLALATIFLLLGAGAVLAGC